MATRALASVIVALVFVYHVQRLMASQCSGAACDWYIPFSLLLPVTAVVLAGVTGGVAAYEVRARRSWCLLLAACAVLACVGPVLATIGLSDNDTKVWLSTLLVMTVPASIVTYAVRHRTTIS